MRKLEKIFIVLILLGAIGSLNRIEQSNLIFLIGCTLLSMLYFFLSFALFNNVTFRNIFKSSSFTSVGRVVGSIGLGIALSICIIGIQFKFLVLEGSDSMLIIGNTLLIFTGIVAATLLFMRNKHQPGFYIRIFKRLIPVLLMGLLSLMVSGEYIVDIRYRNNPKLAELIKQSLDGPYDQELYNKIQEEKAKENSN